MTTLFTTDIDYTGFKWNHYATIIITVFICRLTLSIEQYFPFSILIVTTLLYLVVFKRLPSDFKSIFKLFLIPSMIYFLSGYIYLGISKLGIHIPYHFFCSMVLVAYSIKCLKFKLRPKRSFFIILLTGLFFSYVFYEIEMYGTKDMINSIRSGNGITSSITIDGRFRSALSQIHAFVISMLLVRFKTLKK